MEATFRAQLRDFVLSRSDDVFARHVRPHERYGAVLQAQNAFKRLLKAKVSAETFDEVWQAFLTVEAVSNERGMMASFAHYWQGFRDGLRVSNTEPADLYDLDLDSQRERRNDVAEQIRNIEAAAANGAAHAQEVRDDERRLAARV